MGNSHLTIHSSQKNHRIMKKLLLTLSLIIIASASAWAQNYTFSATAPTGQTLYYNVTDWNTVAIVIPTVNWYGYNKPTESLVIPDSVTYNGATYLVTEIGERAFEYCDSLTAVSIPNTITTIGTSAFDFCLSLDSITIPNSVTTIGDGAFYGCGRLTNITLPNALTRIGESAFYACEGLTRIVIPNTVTSIGAFAFSGCGNLEHILLSNSLTTINEGTFSDCGSLYNISIPNTITNIERSAFANCESLTSIIIPDSVVKIEFGAFSMCMSLTSITIGQSVDTIESCAFDHCSNLTEIITNAAIAPAIDNGPRGTFWQVPDDILIHIPCGSLDSYQSTWTYFSNLVETGTFDFQAESNDENMGSVSVLQQPSCQEPTAVVEAIPTEGYMFERWSDGTTDNPYTLQVTSDTLLKAYFVIETTEGITDAFSPSYDVTTEQGAIVVTGAANERVNVFDITGRLLYQGRIDTEPWRYNVGKSGIYLVQIADTPAKKVVISTN